MDELDDEPTLEDLRLVLGVPAAGKVPGQDDIPSEVIKYVKELFSMSCM